MKIDPSTTSTNLNYGSNPDDGSDEQNSKKGEKDYNPVLPRERHGQSPKRKLANRKTRKKKRKLAERRARQNKHKDDDQS